MGTNKISSLDDLSPDLKSFMNLLVSSGLLADPKISDSKIRKIKQNFNLRAYHNTEMLLNRYRDCEFMLRNLPGRIEDILGKTYKDVDDLVDAVDIEFATGNRKLEAQFEGFEKARVSIDRLLEAITVLKEEPKRGQMLYDVITMRYILPESPENRTIEKIAESLSISTATFNRYRKEAIELISFRLWGIHNASTALAFEAVELFRDYGEMMSDLPNK